MTPPWWQSATIYQIYPRSFLDTSGDGVGDLEGIRRRLDHLTSVGVDALWLSPFYPSPMRDFGYDIADYCDVDPLFGTLAGFDALVSEAHRRDLRVLIDLVPNHTSDQHPWFIESASSRSNAKRDWYVWRDPDPGDPDRPPNNWVAAFTGKPAWTFHPPTGQWYLHLFLPEQPDLNWNNPEVEAAMHAVMSFWLDRGVDGFRVDVAHALGKDPALPDDPPSAAGVPHSSLNNDPRTHAILRRMRALMDSYPGERPLVGEVYLLDTSLVAEYYGQGDELNLAFNFPPLYAPWDASAWRSQIGRAEAEFGPRNAWPTWVLSNHDNPRHRTRYGSEARARAAAVLLLTLRGTPFLYAGEELGLQDAVIPPERRVDPGGRDGCRAPIPWGPEPDHGWASAQPWLPWPPEPETSNMAGEEADRASVLHLYQRLLRERHSSAALALGDVVLVESPPPVLAYERRAGADRRRVAINFSDQPVALAMEGSWRVAVASDGQQEGEAFGGTLAPDQGVLLTPAL